MLRYVTCRFTGFKGPVTKNHAFLSWHGNSLRGQHVAIFLFLEMLYETCLGLHFRYTHTTSHRTSDCSFTDASVVPPPPPPSHSPLSFCKLFNEAVSTKL
jgi:hypothetical protein